MPPSDVLFFSNARTREQDAMNHPKVLVHCVHYVLIFIYGKVKQLLVLYTWYTY